MMRVGGRHVSQSAGTLAHPIETATVGAALLNDDSPYRLVGDKLFASLRDSDFADLYSREGKPGISPVILAFVTIFQFMEKLPDRQAPEAVRLRLDWKFALHLPLTYAGFDYSVLSKFQDRLLALAAFLFANPEAPSDASFFIEEVTNAQAQHVGDPEGRVDAHHERQQVAKTALSP